MTVANFVMEIGIKSQIPTYSGGLGILAGDAALSFADMGLPAAYVTLLYKQGYTSQRLDRSAGQMDLDAIWDYRKLLEPLGTVVDVELAGNVQKVGVWQLLIKGKADVPVFFLDTDLEGNDPGVRQITDRLYGGDHWHRLMQEMVLGVGGYRMLRALGVEVDMYHLNEGHAALLVVELMKEFGEIAEVKKRCVFTAHTPVPAGYDAFPLTMIREAFRNYDWVNWEAEANSEGKVDLSRLAVKYSGVTNAVSVEHHHVSKRVLDHGEVEYVTNGVYHRRWVHHEMKQLYDKKIPGWEESPTLLIRAMELPTEALRAAHQRAKSELLDMVQRSTGKRFSNEDLTVGMGKRVTAYKRNDLVLTDLDRLVAVAEKRGAIQIVLAGKAHPRDAVGKAVLKIILDKIEKVETMTDKVRVTFLENYDIATAKCMVSGCDLWLNNPRRPLEACGTSGMKAAMNGVLNFSVYDGWWLEGGIEGVNGWGIGKRVPWDSLTDGADQDLEDMYQKLSDSILPTYYNETEKWWTMAKTGIATIAPIFNSYRMTDEYGTKVYALAGGCGWSRKDSQRANRAAILQGGLPPN